MWQGLCQVLAILRPQPLADFRLNDAQMKGVVPGIALAFHVGFVGLKTANRAGRCTVETSGITQCAHGHPVVRRSTLNRSKPPARPALNSSRPDSSRPVQAALCVATRRDPARPGFRWLMAIRSSLAAAAWFSANSAQLIHLAANRPHVALLSGDRVNLAIAWHSAANIRNFSDGLNGRSSPVSDA